MGAGDLTVVIEQDIGGLGPRRGPGVTVHCPIQDALRGVVLWGILLALLLARRSNRSVRAWSVLPPLLGIYVLLHWVEIGLNALFVFYLHKDACSMVCEGLRFFAVSLAVVQVSGIRPQWGLVSGWMLAMGFLATWLNPWPGLPFPAWTIVYCVCLSIFQVGHGLLLALQRRIVRSERLETWHVGTCLALGLIPILILGGIEARLDRSFQLQSTLELMRMAILLCSCLLVPYAIKACLMVPCLWNSRWGKTLATWSNVHRKYHKVNKRYFRS